MSLFQVSNGFYILSAKSVAYLIISEASQLVELKTHTHTPGHTGNCKTVEGLTRDMKRIILFVRNAGKKNQLKFKRHKK